MEAGKLEREYHSMITPEIPCREGRKYLFGRTAPRRGVEDVILCNSDFVSRRHCEVFFKNGAFWIKDLKSLNGTFLNDVQLEAYIERELRFGDRVGLGVSRSTTDLDPRLPSYYIFVFKKFEFEVIDIDDDESQPCEVNERGESPDIEILERSSPPSRPARLLAPPPPPRIRPDPSAATTTSSLIRSTYHAATPSEVSSFDASDAPRVNNPTSSASDAQTHDLSTIKRPHKSPVPDSSVESPSKAAAELQTQIVLDIKSEPTISQIRIGQQGDKQPESRPGSDSKSFTGRTSSVSLQEKDCHSKYIAPKEETPTKLSSAPSSDLSTSGNLTPRGQKRKPDNGGGSDTDNIPKVPKPSNNFNMKAPDVGILVNPSSASSNAMNMNTVHIKGQSPNTAPTVRKVHRTSTTESSSGDDSSDGLRTESVSILQKRTSSSRTPEPHKDEFSKLSQLDSAPVSTKSKSTPCPSVPDTASIDQSMSHRGEVQKDMKLATSVIKMRQLIRLARGTPTIRRCKFICLSPSNREKIFRQWKTSKKRCKAQLKRSQHSTFDSESSDSSDCIVPPKNIKRSTVADDHKTQEPSGSDKPVTRVTIKDSSTTDSDSSDDQPTRPKMPNIGGKKSASNLSKSLEHDDQIEQTFGSPELFSYSQPYDSPDQSLSPISNDDDVDVNESVQDPKRSRIDSVSDISEEEEEDFQMDVSSPASTSSPIYESTSVSPVIPEDTKKSRGPHKQIIVIDHAPPPRDVRRRSKGVVERAKVDNFIGEKNWIPNKPSPLIAPTIKERLKTIAAVEKATSSSSHASDVPKPLSRAPVNMKSTKMNRTDELLESLMASSKSKVDGIPEDRHKLPANKIDEPFEKPILVAPRRELHLMPSPATQALMPVNVIKPNMMPPPTIKIRQEKVLHLGEVNPMEKPGVEIERQRRNDSTKVFDYRHSFHVPKPPPNPGSISRTNGDNKPVLQDDAAYRYLLKWRPAWLEEQKKMKGVPPVTAKLEIVRTLLDYADYKSYVSIFFPLILLEIWATVTQDYSSKRTFHGRPCTPLAEFPIAVTKCETTNVCPMMDTRWQNKDIAKLKDNYYTVVDCFAIVNHPKEIDQKRDLVIVTFETRWLNPKNPKEVVQKPREFFGFILNGSERSSLMDSNSIIPQKLKDSNPQAKHLFNFSVVIHAGVDLDKSKLGKMQKISYVSPKLRDVKALLYLRNSKLHNHIIHPKPPTVVWNPHAVISQHQIVQHVAKLNPTQKSAIAHVADRLKSNDPELLLVHGPPGTGKTRTIVGMILQLLSSKMAVRTSDRRLLVCTPSNTAVDEIMLRLEEAIKELPTTASSEINKITMLRFGELGSSSMKKYSVDAYLKKADEANSMNISIRKSIEMCKKSIHSKEAEINSLKKNNGSKTRIQCINRELEQLRDQYKDFSNDLAKTRTETGSHSFDEKKQILENANVIFSTLNSCSNHLLTSTFGARSGRKTKPFLCCIVDEASQTTEPENLAPLLLQIDKMILVGDPQQLGATVLSQEAESKEFNQSMFSRLYNFTQSAERPHSIMMLTQQYRMHPEILAWPNEYFYKGLLKTQCIGRSADDECLLKPYLFLNLSSQETSDRTGQISNEEEAKMVLGMIQNIHLVLESEKKRKLSIGVITPYSTQRAAIANDIKRELSQIADNVEVETVDSFQGREKDIIIISCVRTDDTGFLKNSKRLNVALTRARHSLLIVGDAECLRKDSMWRSLIENAKERKCLYDIPKSEWNVPGFLKKRLFQLLSPQKSLIPEDMRRRERF